MSAFTFCDVKRTTTSYDAHASNFSPLSKIKRAFAPVTPRDPVAMGVPNGRAPWAQNPYKIPNPPRPSFLSRRGYFALRARAPAFTNIYCAPAILRNNYSVFNLPRRQNMLNLGA